MHLLRSTALLLFLQAVPLHAAAIDWDAPTTISADSDVLTLGTHERAYNFGDAGLGTFVVNGTTFDPFAITGSSTTVGSTTLSTASSAAGHNTAFGFAAGPFSGLSNSYQALLQSAAFGNNGFPFTLTLNNLTPGGSYIIQIWINDSRVGTADRTGIVSATDSVTLDVNVINSDGGVGQFATGTFTADSTSQTVSIDGGTVGAVLPSPLINAFALRAVPEPASAMLACTGMTLLTLGRRRLSPDKEG